jgi:hypothetical protein
MTIFWDVAPCSVVEIYRCFSCLISLMMEAVSTVNFYQTTRHNMSDSNFHTRHRENLKSHDNPFSHRFASFSMLMTEGRTAPAILMVAKLGCERSQRRITARCKCSLNMLPPASTCPRHPTLRTHRMEDAQTVYRIRCF